MQDITARFHNIKQFQVIEYNIFYNIIHQVVTVVGTEYQS